ncbi:hypothetical protein [Paludibaculum fermentans]|uniref:hypothetical protein n=1 Tax=Paludibaculum fermentans TaxID=1473598 RepID=UPI003EBA40F1
MNALDPLLRLCGIDPVRYGLLLGLFGKISERREMLGQLGRDGFTLKAATLLYAVMAAFLSVLMLMAQPTLPGYAGVFLFMTGFLLFTILLTETSNSLVNPTEALILAHQPVDGATYTAAKLTHLLRIVLYLAPGLNVVPALAALVLPGCPLYYPLLHLAGAMAVGLFIALLCCSIFGWLLRIAPPSRVKSWGQAVEAVPLVFLSLAQFVPRLFTRLPFRIALPQDPTWRNALIAGFVIVALAVGISGIRALSGDFLIRVSSMVQGRSTRIRGSRRSRLGGLVARLRGGPPARAGFHYVSAMMWRDWQFRRQLLPMLPMLIIPFIEMRRVSYSSVFSIGFTPIHLVPHITGALLFFISTLLVYGTDHKGTWIFLLAPSGSLQGIANGTHAALWTRIILAPHVLLLLVTSWYWGVVDALLFAAFSMAMASFYLGLELRLIEGLPFSKQPETTRSPFMMPLMLGGGLAMAAIVALQYFVIFRSRLTVLGVTAIVAAGAWAVTRLSLQALGESIRFHLGVVSAESGTIYHEID